MTDQDMLTYNKILRQVLSYFNDDWDKATLWFRSPNPGLGYLVPNDMIRLGRIGKLEQFISNALAANEAGAKVPS